MSFLGREFSGQNGAETFEVSSSLTNIFDGWTVDLPVGPGGLNLDLPGLNVHRWTPVKLAHADPQVGGGKPVPMLMGVCTNLELDTSEGASVLRLTGFDLGKLLDSCARPWIRLRGLSLGAMIEKLLDPSWLAKNRTDSWGIQGVTALHRDRSLKLGQRISLGRQQVQIDVSKTYGQLMPPLQVEVGETVYDILSRFSRLTGLTASTGSFVNCSADGYVQIFNPDIYKDEPPQYVFEHHDDSRNYRIKRARLLLSGEDLYSEYNCFGSVVAPPQQYAQDKITNPNAGRFSGQDQQDILGPEGNRIYRRLTFSDAEQYERGFAKVRAQWRRRQSLYKELAVQLTIQGHSMPGPDGTWRPLVEGNVAELNSSKLRIKGRFMLEQVTKRQNGAVGTEADVVLRKLGLLGV